jgi:Zn-dependent protease
MFTGMTGLQLFFLLISMLIGMSTHEAMHAFTSHWLGDDTAERMGRLTLNPLKHIDIVTTVLLPVVLIAVGLPPIFAAKPVPFNPARVKWDEYGAALIGVAGPITNLALACIGGLVFRLVPLSTNTLSDFVVIFTLTNVSLFVFNMIPFPPLDGSRLLYAVAPDPVREFMMQIERFGITIIFVIFILLAPVIGPGISHISESILHFLLGV